MDNKIGKIGVIGNIVIIVIGVIVIMADSNKSNTSSRTTSSSSSSSYQSSSSSRKTENTNYEKKVCQDPYGNWHSHISTCATCGTSYCVEYLSYGKYCSQGCCAAYEGISSKCGY